MQHRAKRISFHNTAFVLVAFISSVAFLFHDASKSTVWSLTLGKQNMASHRVNPMVPDSVGGLLAEEWTIDPHSTLPSSLELAIIEEGRLSLWEGLKSVVETIQLKLSQVGHLAGTDPSSDIALIQRLVMLKSRVYLTVAKFLKRYGPEARALLIYLLERRMLLSSTISASLMENLNGMRRVQLGAPVGGEENSQQRKLTPLSKDNGIRLALALALGPYISERGEAYLKYLQERQEQQQHQSNPPSSRRHRLSKIFQFVFPIVFSTSKGWNLWQRWKYLLGETVFPDPISAILQLVVRRNTAQDINSAPTPETKKSTTSSPISWDPQKSPLTNHVLNMLTSTEVQKAAFVVILSAVGTSWLAQLQKTRQEIRRHYQMEHPELAPLPPHIRAPSHSKRLLPSCPPTHCPICRQPRILPTASTGGFVFCLSCLTKALQMSPICPMTGKACPPSKIIRLFEPSST